MPCTGESKHDINRLEYLMVVPPKKEHNYDQECPKTELAVHKWLTVTHLLNAFKEDIKNSIDMVNRMGTFSCGGIIKETNRS